jgi:hypothetical protein
MRGGVLAGVWGRGATRGGLWRRIVGVLHLVLKRGQASQDLAIRRCERQVSRQSEWPREARRPRRALRSAGPDEGRESRDTGRAG